MAKGGKTKGKREPEGDRKSLPWVPVLLVAVLILAGALVLQNRPGPVADGGGTNTSGRTYASLVGAPNSEHTHSVWSFLLDGRDVTQAHFGKFKYQVRSPNVHMEAGNTELHKHATGVTVGYFFESLGILFDGKRFLWPAEGLRLEANETHGFRLFVNGREDPRLGYFEPAGTIESPSTYTWCLQFGPLNEAPCAGYAPRIWPISG
ncbi:MAG: hypothetical protein QXO51_04120 [Halobacteria archaeon]